MAFLSPKAKREEVRNRYPGEDWAYRVEQMDDGQIHAIWARLQEEKGRRAPEVEVPKESDPNASDLPTLF